MPARRLSTEKLILLSLLLVGLIFLSFENYLFFHSTIELFSVIIAASILIIAVNTHYISQNDYFMFLGIAYGFIAGFDLLHILAYKGMGVFPQYGPNLPTQLWIVPRYLESISLLASIAFIKREINIKKTFYLYLVISLLVLFSIFSLGIFPDCFIPGQGLTTFKKLSEYNIIFILIIAIIMLKKNEQAFGPRVYNWLRWSIIMTILSEVSFTIYLDVYGLPNMLGHIFKFISFVLIYKAIIETSLKNPYDSLFYKLKEERDKFKRHATTDSLTNVLNRRTGIRYLREQMDISRSNDSRFSICFIDLDDLTMINNNYGHKEGDKALLKVSKIITQSIREYDVVSRFGGDEFLVVFYQCELDQAKIVWKRILNKLSHFNQKSDKPYQLSFSYGFAEYNPEEEITVDELISEADRKMYRKKEEKKEDKKAVYRFR